MIPNLKTDLKEFGKTMLQIACILFVTLAVFCAIVYLFVSSAQEETEYDMTTSFTQSQITPVEAFT